MSAPHNTPKDPSKPPTNPSDTHTLPSSTSPHDANLSNKELYTSESDEVNTLASDLKQHDKKVSREEATAFKNDDAATIVEGKGRRDVNGKIMTKRENAAEVALKVVFSCVVM